MFATSDQSPLKRMAGSICSSASHLVALPEAWLPFRPLPPHPTPFEASTALQTKPAHNPLSFFERTSLVHPFSNHTVTDLDASLADHTSRFCFIPLSFRAQHLCHYRAHLTPRNTFTSQNYLVKMTRSILALLATAGLVAAQGVTDKISPKGDAPATCKPAWDGKFELTVASVVSKRDIAVSSLAATA
jgi:hypothetical protein